MARARDLVLDLARTDSGWWVVRDHVLQGAKVRQLLGGAWRIPWRRLYEVILMQVARDVAGGWCLVRSRSEFEPELLGLFDESEVVERGDLVFIFAAGQVDEPRLQALMERNGSDPDDIPDVLMWPISNLAEARHSLEPLLGELPPTGATSDEASGDIPRQSKDENSLKAVVMIMEGHLYLHVPDASRLHELLAESAAQFNLSLPIRIPLTSEALPQLT